MTRTTFRAAITVAITAWLSSLEMPRVRVIGLVADPEERPRSRESGLLADPEEMPRVRVIGLVEDPVERPRSCDIGLAKVAETVDDAEDAAEDEAMVMTDAGDSGLGAFLSLAASAASGGLRVCTRSMLGGILTASSC